VAEGGRQQLVNQILKRHFMDRNHRAAEAGQL